MSATKKPVCAPYSSTKPTKTSTSTRAEPSSFNVGTGERRNKELEVDASVDVVVELRRLMERVEREEEAKLGIPGRVTSGITLRYVRVHASCF